MYDGTIDLTQENNARTKIVRLVEPGSRVLEVGCATGFMTEFLVRQLDCTVTAVEIDAESAERVAARGIDVIVGSIENPAVFSQLAGPYDLAIFSDVLEHLVDPAAVLRAVVPLVADGGRVVASIPNVAHWSIRARLLAGHFEYTEGGILDQGHLRFFTQRTIDAMFRSVGFAPTFDAVHMFPAALPIPRHGRRWLAHVAPRLVAFQFIVEARKAVAP